MKKDSKHTKKKDGLVNNYRYANSKKVMSSNLPLLFANGRPRSLETISQTELEDFVPFMILCSLGQELHTRPKEINNCPVPEWWPQGFPFKFPLVEQSDWINKQVMLKSLVCRCYTFYDCEFLLKFSSELAEMPPNHLKYEENKDEGTTSIYDAAGVMLVKCRNENLHYDKHNNRRKYLSPTNAAPASLKSGKRKTSVEVCEEPAAKQRCVRRVFYDFPMEQPEPVEVNQEQFLEKFQLIPKGKEIVPQILKVERKKRLAHAFTFLSVSSKRGQDLLMRNKHSFNLEASLERIDRFCGPVDQQDTETNHITTRASVIFSAMFKDDTKQNEPEVVLANENQLKWCHSYKWPYRTRNPRFPHRGPALKPCSVVLTLISEELIDYWTKRKRTVATMTPERWGYKTAICSCQKIPLITLDDDTFSKYKTKSSSTRCTCGKSKTNFNPASQTKKAPQEIKIEDSNKEVQMGSSTESQVKVRNRSQSENSSLASGSFVVSRSNLTRTVSHPVSFDKEGLGVISYNPVHHSESPLNFKRALHRKPLAVVPSTPIVDKGISAVICQPPPCLPQRTFHASSIKINFNRSILDAIKWYTKDDPIFEPIECEYFVREEWKVLGIDPSQENIKPITKLTLPNYKKPVDYFTTTYGTERDYCFKRSSGGTSKLVTRRGERHYVNREPCPSCFQGRDNFCVYEFIRQAKLAGVTLHKNQKRLQLIFFKLIQAVNGKA